MDSRAVVAAPALKHCDAALVVLVTPIAMYVGIDIGCMSKPTRLVCLSVATRNVSMSSVVECLTYLEVNIHAS